MAINPFRFAANPAPQHQQQPGQAAMPSPDDWIDPASQTAARNSPTGLRKEANALSARAANFSPVKSPWEGLARLGEGFEAGVAQGQADREERNRDWLASSQPGAQTVDPLNLCPQRQFPGILGMGQSLSPLLGGAAVDSESHLPDNKGILASILARRGGVDPGSTGGLW